MSFLLKHSRNSFNLMSLISSILYLSPLFLQIFSCLYFYFSLLKFLLCSCWHCFSYAPHLLAFTYPFPHSSGLPTHHFLLKLHPPSVQKISSTGFSTSTIIVFVQNICTYLLFYDFCSPCLMLLISSLIFFNIFVMTVFNFWFICSNSSASKGTMLILF